MSTDQTTASRSERAGRARFRRSTLILIGVLIVTAASLAAANTVQGPRLSSAEVNPQAAITRPDQRLVLRANQPIAEPQEWSIIPDTPADISVHENTISIRFAKPLKYNTEYVVEVGVKGEFTGASGHLRHTFTTPDVELFSLLRDDNSDEGGGDRQGRLDRILRHTLSGSLHNETVFQAPRIQEYAVLDNRLAIVTSEEDGASSLLLSSTTESATMTIYTPPASTVHSLKASRSADLIGYILDSNAGVGDDANALFIYDTTHQSGMPTKIIGIDGAPLPVMDWVFVPGTGSVIAQSLDHQLYLIDPFEEGSISPIGQHTEMRGFVPGTVQLVVTDPLSGAVLDLAEGTSTPLALSEPDVDENMFADKLILLDEDRYIQLYNEIDYTSSQVTSVLLHTDDTGTHELFRPASATARIRDLCLSPNRQYLAVEVISGEGKPDGYSSLPGYSAITTHLIDVEDGTRSRGISGFLPDWCR